MHESCQSLTDSASIRSLGGFAGKEEKRKTRGNNTYARPSAVESGEMVKLVWCRCTRSEVSNNIVSRGPDRDYLPEGRFEERDDRWLRRVACSDPDFPTTTTISERRPGSCQVFRARNSRCLFLSLFLVNLPADIRSESTKCTIVPLERIARSVFGLVRARVHACVRAYLVASISTGVFITSLSVAPRWGLHNSTNCLTTRAHIRT